MTGDELEYIREAHASGQLASDGQFTGKCQDWLQEQVGCARAILTNSCTDALEMSALLADIQPGDEVIMPSFTFVSTANAFVLRGGVPVFVDIDRKTLNIDPDGVEAALTSKTKAIVPVHYAGVGCEMNRLSEIAGSSGALLIEDAAHALCSTYLGRPLGGIGHLAAFSFHETKNVICGEGGALLINDPRLLERAEVIAQKGTDRARFMAGETDKYTWVDVGSSFMPSELVAAFLWAQIQQAQAITNLRKSIWDRYHEAFAELESKGLARRPHIPEGEKHNAHLYYLFVDSSRRADFLSSLKKQGIGAHFHFVPLHSSPAGRRFGRACGSMSVTDDAASSIVRLPLWVGLSEKDQDRVIRAVYAELGIARGRSGEVA